MTKNEAFTAATFPSSLNENEGNILFISGSNSIKSINLQLVTLLAETRQQDQTRLIELNDFSMPMYSESEEAKGIPAATRELLQIIDDYDLLVIAVPEHNHAVPAFFKNTIDWISRTSVNYQSLAGKKIILVNACPGNGGSHTVLNASEILQVLGAEIVGAVVLKQFYNNTHDKNGKLQVTNGDFLSQFDNLVAISGIGETVQKIA
jgi:NAD(P)H-dependent FMN reductase